MNETWISFDLAATPPGRKTSIWIVRQKDGTALGDVRWYGPWRCYSFFPLASTVFERKCLRDIADFCERQTQARRRNVP